MNKGANEDSLLETLCVCVCMSTYGLIYLGKIGKDGLTGLGIDVCLIIF